jgi:HK97 family phage prohead protease
MASKLLKQEQRSTTLALRSADDDGEFAITGVAASFGTYADIGGEFRERIAPGAFKDTLQAGENVRCLLNHDVSKILASTRAGTLALKETNAGLMFAAQLDKGSQIAQETHRAIKRGDISECSFTFTVPDGGDVWDMAQDPTTGERFTRRTLLKVNLMEVSPVTFPAYKQGTSVYARAMYTTSIEECRARGYVSRQAFTNEERDRMNLYVAHLFGMLIDRDAKREADWEAMQERLRGARGF